MITRAFMPNVLCQVVVGEPSLILWKSLIEYVVSEYAEIPIKPWAERVTPRAAAVVSQQFMDRLPGVARHRQAPG